MRWRNRRSVHYRHVCVDRALWAKAADSQWNANRRISDAVAERLGVPQGKVFQNIDRYGNTTGASVPILLETLHATT